MKPVCRIKMSINRGDDVIVISGKDKGKKGKVIEIDRSLMKIIVEGVSVATYHKKAKKEGDVSGRLKKETPIYASKVMVICRKCKNPTRVGRRVVSDGKHERYCKKCNGSVA